MTLPVRLSTVDDTRAYGAKLTAVLRAGDLVVLTGPLGAGKTALVQGIGVGLGVRGPVLSPTFVIARVHRPGRLPLVHVDAYRMKGPEDFVELGLDEDIGAGACVAVEWAEIVEAALPPDRLVVRLDHASEARRRASVEATGPVSRAWLTAAAVGGPGGNPK